MQQRWSKRPLSDGLIHGLSYIGIGCLKNLHKLCNSIHRVSDPHYNNAVDRLFQ